MRKVSKIEPISPSLPTRKKVAAYARVSMETERLNHSLSAQVSYYSNEGEIPQYYVEDNHEARWLCPWYRRCGS